MKVIWKIFKILATILILVIIFNRVAPLFLGNVKDNNASDVLADNNAPVKTIELLNGEVVVSARLVEYGRWIILIQDVDELLESAFEEVGMLPSEPEFNLFIKSKIVQSIPDIDFDASLLKADGCCQGDYEVHVKGRNIVLTIFDIFKNLYQSKESLFEEVARFKKEVKECMNSEVMVDSFVCIDLQKNPLPKPEPRILYITEDGEDVPMKGFSECYFRLLKEYDGEISEEVSENAKEECYSEW